MDELLEKRLRLLLDEDDIRKVLLKYCQSVDRCDLESLTSCFHPDAIDDHGSWVKFGRDVPGDIVGRLQPNADSLMHFIGNIKIEVLGDIGLSESYMLAFRSFERDSVSYTRTRALRFVDRFERRGGEWRIAERVVVDDWNRVDAVGETMAETPLFRSGSKDGADPVFAIRTGRVAREPGATAFTAKG